MIYMNGRIRVQPVSVRTGAVAVYTITPDSTYVKAFEGSENEALRRVAECVDYMSRIPVLSVEKWADLAFEHIARNAPEPIANIMVA